MPKVNHVLKSLSRQDYFSGLLIDNPVIADAILDRLSRDRHQIKLRGESLRRREASFDGL